MEILDSYKNNGQSVFYTVALEPGFLVDVKVCTDTGLVYVMQNEDGSTVYDQALADHTFPDYQYAEEAVIRFVKDTYENTKGKEIKPALDDMMNSAAVRIKQQARRAMNSLDQQISFNNAER